MNSSSSSSPSPSSAPLSASEERTAVSAVFRTTLKEGETWSIIDEKWSKQWSNYAGFDLASGRLMDAKAGTRPGILDNGKIVDQATGDGPAVLKRPLMEHFDYVVVPVEVADLLFSWYSGGPRVDRQVRLVGIYRSAQLNLYPTMISLIPLDNSGQPDNSNKQVKILEPAETLSALRKSLLAGPEEKEGKNTEQVRKNKPTQRPEVKKAIAGKISISLIFSFSHRRLPIEFSKNFKGKNQQKKKKKIPSNSNSFKIFSHRPSLFSLSSLFLQIRFWVENSDRAKEQKELENTAAYKRRASADSTTTTANKKFRTVSDYKLLPEEDYSSSIDSLSSSSLFIDRLQSNGSWRRSSGSGRDWKDFHVGDHIDAKDSVNKWYEALVEDVSDDKILVHFIGWNEKWDEWIDRNNEERLKKLRTHTTAARESSVTSSYSSSYTGMGVSSYSSLGSSSYYSSWGNSSVGTPSPSGAVGFSNLGNTCFMNSILQSMMHCPILTPYFRAGAHVPEINRDNPLGWKGKIAEKYSDLVDEYWSDKYTVVAPRSFKDALGEFQPRFSGYQQQDSSELLSFLLDGLHEDLNLVLKKPPTPSVDSNNRPDSVVSAEAWVTHLKRNQSIIVDLFQGQLKSKLVCPEASCGKISITFDPFSFISLPLPSVAECFVAVHLVSAGAITLYRVTVPKIARLKELKAALGGLAGVSPSRLVLADLASNKFYRLYQDDDQVGDIRSTDVTYAYELPAIDNFAKTSDFCTVQVVNSHMAKNRFFDPQWSRPGTEFSLESFGTPGVIVLPRKTTFTMAWLKSQVEELAQSSACGAEPLDLEIRLLSSDTRGCYNCEYMSRCNGCLLNASDEEFPLQFDRVENEPKLAISIIWKNREQYNDNREKAIARHSSTDSLTSAKKAETIPLSACFEAFAVSEVLGGEDLWYCSNCKDFRAATKQMAVWTAPPILVIHLKRFSYSRISRDKITTQVDFPLDDFDMAPYLGAGNSPALYECFAVSHHSGGLSGGHYWATLRSLSTGDWYQHNDSSVSKLRDLSEVISSTAYVLFYKRKDATHVKNRLDLDGNFIRQEAPPMENLTQKFSETVQLENQKSSQVADGSDSEPEDYVKIPNGGGLD